MFHKNNLEKAILVLGLSFVFVLLSLTVVSAKVWNNRFINYDQDIYFYDCSSNKLSFSCNNQPLNYIKINFTDPSLTPTNISSGCYLYVIPNNYLPCTRIKVSNGARISVRHPVYNPEKIALYQTPVGSFGSVEETAMAIWQMRPFKSLQIPRQKALNYLLYSRDENGKCWPRNDCSAQITAKVLAYLRLAGYDNSSRLLFDGERYLDSFQNYLKTNNLIISIKATEDEECNYTYYHDSKPTNKIFTLKKDEVKEFKVKPSPFDVIKLDCDDDVKLRVLDEDRNELYYDRDDEIYYEIPLGCIYSTRAWDSCDVPATLYYAFLDTDKKRNSQAIEFLKRSLIKGRIAGKYIGSNNPVIDTSLYQILVPEEYDTLTYLKLAQNNDGSYLNNSYYATSFVAYALSPIKSAQDYVMDAYAYLIDNYYHNQDIINRYPLFFKAVFEVPVYVKFNPKVVYITNLSYVEVYNPTVYNISLNLTSSTKCLKLNKTALLLPPKSVQNLSLSANTSCPPYAYIKFFYNHTIVGKLPVIYSSFSPTLTSVNNFKAPFSVYPLILKYPHNTSVNLKSFVFKPLLVRLMRGNITLRTINLTANSSLLIRLNPYLINQTPRYTTFSFASGNTTIDVKVIIESSNQLTGNVVGMKRVISYWPFLLVALLLTGGAYLGYAFMKRKKQSSSDTQKNLNSETDPNFEENEIIELIKIMRSLAQATNQTDEDIRKQLEEQGFAKEEIDAAFNNIGT